MTTTMFEMQAEGIRVVLDMSVGHIAELAIEHDGRRVRPLHRAPWVDTNEPMPDGLPRNVARLSGDFFCAPFSRNDVEEAPTHGWPANSEWDLVDEQRIAGESRARFRLRRVVFGAALEKVLTLRDGHPFLYQEHVFHGGQGDVPVAHHTMVRMAGGGRIAFSPKRAAVTPAEAPEPDAARGRSLFAYPARTQDLTRMPLAAGGFADLARFPPGERHEDFLSLVEATHSGIGFTAISRSAEQDVVLVLKNPVALPVTMLWYSNGGRDYAPWSGRHVGVLGIEDGISAVGHRQSLGDNLLKREGVETTLRLDPESFVSVRQVIGWAALTGVAAIEVEPDLLVLWSDAGERNALPFDDDFLSGAGS